ncbi:hypothetical protein [Phyllobacterium phragmitis]|uniref:hypothetical protein n=1 Tax=Phyllobacterium phragmitis TaxID=2670329 RepID=UPI0011B2967A|nr:hypothetical protein [Phyllobacterium phragmitis]
MKKQLLVWSTLTFLSVASLVPNAPHIFPAKIPAVHANPADLPFDDLDDEAKEDRWTESRHGSAR